MNSLQVGRARYPVADNNCGTSILNRFKDLGRKTSGKRLTPQPEVFFLWSVQESARKNASDRRESERLHVGHDIFNLRRFQDFLEWGHQGVAVFDPGFQGLIGNFIVVDRERSAF